MAGNEVAFEREQLEFNLRRLPRLRDIEGIQDRFLAAAMEMRAELENTVDLWDAAHPDRGAQQIADKIVDVVNECRRQSFFIKAKIEECIADIESGTKKLDPLDDTAFPSYTSSYFDESTDESE